MTDRHIKNNRSSVDLSATIPWVNDSGEVVPAYGVVQLRTAFDTTSHASKPNGTDGLFFTSGFAPVIVGGTGESLVWDRPRPVLLAAGVVVGDEVGPVESSWSMTVDGTGFRVLRQRNADGRRLWWRGAHDLVHHRFPSLPRHRLRFGDDTGCDSDTLQPKLYGNATRGKLRGYLRRVRYLQLPSRSG